MQVFNVISLENCFLVGTIKAENYKKACEIAEEKGISMDDHILETPEESKEWYEKNNQGRTIYLDEDSLR